MKNLENEIKKAVNLYQSQKFLEAETLAKKILKLNPKVSFLYNLLGLICASSNNNSGAIKYYEEGIKINPSYAMLYNNLANSYKLIKNYNNAEEYYKKSIALDKKIPEPHNNLGNLYKELNKLNDAVLSFKNSIKVNSKFYIGFYNLGITYKSMGKIDEAKNNLKKAIILYPKFYKAHRAFSQLHKYKRNDDHLKIMERFYNEQNGYFLDKDELGFALGKAFNDFEDFDNAFNYYKNANKMRRKKIEFSTKKEFNDFSNIKNLFKIDFINKFKPIKNNDTSAIFILGMPRSGTTLVEQIVSSHSKVFAGDELNFFNELIKKNFYEGNNFVTKKVAESNKEDFIRIGNDYGRKTKEISDGSILITDKLPINFKWIGFIKLILPKAKIIHCIRNSKDTCFSIYKNYFSNNELNYAYDIGELVKFYNLYENLMKFWKKKFPNSIIDIQYEDLIKNPNLEIPNLIKSCDLSWDENCMKFYKNKRTVKTASDTQVRKKIYTDSVNSWKRYKKYLDKDFLKLNS